MTSDTTIGLQVAYLRDTLQVGVPSRAAGRCHGWQHLLDHVDWNRKADARSRRIDGRIDADDLTTDIDQWSA